FSIGGGGSSSGSSGSSGGGVGGRGGEGVWRCVRDTERKPALSEVASRGALGLSAFVRLKRSGTVDVFARVAAVSPIISVRKAPPFFMLEVEQADQQRQQQQQHQQPQQQQHPEQNIVNPLETDGRPSPSLSRWSQRPPPPERNFAEFSRSPAEISALFAAGGAAAAPSAAPNSPCATSEDG
ncbi:unnamed protein product, partial [Laminaria digitata]